MKVFNTLSRSKEEFIPMEPGAHRPVAGALLVGLVDDLVVDIGKVLHKGDAVPPVLQVPPQHVKDAEGPGVADVDEVIDGGAAGVHLHLPRLRPPARWCGSATAW